MPSASMRLTESRPLNNQCDGFPKFIRQHFARCGTSRQNMTSREPIERKRTVQAPSFPPYRMTLALRAVAVFLISLTAAFAQLGALGGKDQVTPSLAADTTAVVPGKPFTVLVQLKLKTGWHVYWQFPGDSGLPPKVTWDLPAGFTADAIQWPVPAAHIDAGDLLTYIHEGEALLPVTIHPPANIEAKEILLKAKLSWLVCEEVCVPGQGSVSLTLPVATEAQSNNAELFASARSRLPKSDPPPFKTEWNVKADQVSVALSGLPADAKVEFFPLPPSGIKPGRPEVSEADASGKRTIAVPVTSGGKDDTAWRGVVTAQMGTGPVSGWIIQAKAETLSPPPTRSTGAPTRGISVPGDPTAESAKESPVPPSTKAESVLDANSFGRWLYLACLGGLILNLMPCVLPVIALKIFSFVSQAGQDPKRVFRLGLAFVAGVFTFFLLIACLAIGLRAAGKNFFWGMQFADPRLFIALISIVIIFALVMFGTFEITLGGAENALGTLSRKEGYSGAFIHGLFTTLLGTSCTAPLVGPVLGFAVTQPPIGIIAIFLSMAAGMSLPYFLLTWQPAWMRFLPKPGAWMERFKQLMGFVLLGVAVWLLGAMGKARGVEPMAATAEFLAILAFAGWIYGAGARRWWAAIVALIVVGVGGKFFIPDALKKTKGTEAIAAANEYGITWETFSAERLSEATKQRLPVFIDFTADWCINCKTNENLVINTNAVSNALKEKKVVTMKADWTDLDPAIGEWIKKFNRIGVPVYVLYRPGEDQPVVFPELLTQKILLDELNKIAVGT